VRHLSRNRQDDAFLVSDVDAKEPIGVVENGV